MAINNKKKRFQESLVRTSGMPFRSAISRYKNQLGKAVVFGIRPDIPIVQTLVGRPNLQAASIWSDHFQSRSLCLIEPENRNVLGNGT